MREIGKLNACLGQLSAFKYTHSHPSVINFIQTLFIWTDFPGPKINVRFFYDLYIQIFKNSLSKQDFPRPKGFG